MKVLISCGDASGDIYAGALVHALRARDPHLQTFGFGGARMAEAGADLIGDYRGFTVTGLIEAISVLPRSWRMLRRLGDTARERRPDVFVAIDFPDFNLRLLPAMHGLGIPIVYYVSPQLWAWRMGRLETIRKYVNRMLVIFPFEQRMYEDAGVPVEFVGHPMVDVVGAPAPRDAYLRSHGLDPARPVLAFLPGSRPNEVRHMLPTLARAARRLSDRLPNVQYLVARAPWLDGQLFAPLDELRAAGLSVAIVEGDADGVLASADAVVTASGTATVQTALHQRPMVVVYRLAPMTYVLARRVVRVTTYGMVNLIAERPVVRELIQDAFTPDAVADEAFSLLTDVSRRDAMMRDLADVKQRLGGSGASDRAADAVLAAARNHATRV